MYFPVQFWLYLDQPQGRRSPYADYTERVGPQALGGAHKLRLIIIIHYYHYFRIGGRACSFGTASLNQHTMLSAEIMKHLLWSASVCFYNCVTQGYHTLNILGSIEVYNTSWNTGKDFYFQYCKLCFHPFIHIDHLRPSVKCTHTTIRRDIQMKEELC